MVHHCHLLLLKITLPCDNRHNTQQCEIHYTFLLRSYMHTAPRQHCTVGSLDRRRSVRRWQEEIGDVGSGKGQGGKDKGEIKEEREPQGQKYLLIALFSFPADKPLDGSMCQCENVVRFQNQVTEKLEYLVRTNILERFCLSALSRDQLQKRAENVR